MFAAMLPTVKGLKRMVGEQSQSLGDGRVSGSCGNSPGMPCPSGISTDPSPGLGAALPVGRGHVVAPEQPGSNFNSPLKCPQ